MSFERSRSDLISSRNLYQFGNMISYKLDISILEAYNLFDGYGFWCGKGGNGQPVDEIDECCKVHDKCYDAAIDQFDCSPKVVTYTYNYDKPTDTLNCKQGQMTCENYVCQCDKAAAFPKIFKNTRVVSKDFVQPKIKI